MKNNLLLILFLILCNSIFSQYYVRGDHNGWGTGNQLVQRTALSSGSTYSTVIQASFDQQFKIANSGWSTQWGGGYWITSYDQRWTIGANGGNAIWKGSILAYTQVNTLNPDNYINQNLPTGIMTLSGYPVGVSAVSQIGTDIGGGTFHLYSTLAQTVNITLSAAKSTEEKVYLRYTTNNWSTSSFVLASGSGTAYTATIPGQGDETSVSYYVLTTTLTHSTGNDLDQYTDLMTLNFNTNNGSNYTYQVKEKYGFFASAVYLQVNNAASEFYNCHGHGGAFQIGTNQFTGNLGSFPQNSDKLLLNGAEIKTWKNAAGNVCTPNLYYRVFSAGNPSGSFIAFDLPFFCDCTSGAFSGSCGGGTCSANDQKWQSPGAGTVENINLLNRTPGDYTLQVYFDIPGNHNGTSGCSNTVYDNNNGNNYSINFTVTAPMPLNFLSVEANQYGDNVLLSWSTEYENGNSYFEIQRSRDGSNFKKIGIVISSGMSTKQFSYEFLDELPLIKNNIYRIKQIDLDGKYMFSPSVSVYMSSKIRSFEINPNIIDNNLMAEFGKPTESGILQIYDLSGKISKRIILSKGIENIHINAADLIPGLYIARYIDGEETISKKFIKQ
jgi:hypothetical protein